MILQYLKKKENKEMISSNFLYLKVIKTAKKFFFLKIFNHNLKNFDTVFEFTTILIFCIFYASNKKIVNKNQELKKENQELMNIFIKDLDHSLRLSGIGDMSIGKHVKAYVKKFYYRISKLEKIFNDDDYEFFYTYLLSRDIVNNEVKITEIHRFYDDLKKIVISIKNSQDFEDIDFDIFN